MRSHPLVITCTNCGKQNTIVTEDGDNVGYFIPVKLLEEFQTGDFSVILKILSKFEKGDIRKLYVCKYCGTLLDTTKTLKLGRKYPEEYEE